MAPARKVAQEERLTVSLVVPPRKLAWTWEVWSLGPQSLCPLLLLFFLQHRTKPTSCSLCLEMPMAGDLQTSPPSLTLWRPSTSRCPLYPQPGSPARAWTPLLLALAPCMPSSPTAQLSFCPPLPPPCRSLRLDHPWGPGHSSSSASRALKSGNHFNSSPDGRFRDVRGIGGSQEGNSHKSPVGRLRYLPK